MSWYYHKRDRREGPIDDSAIRRMAALSELEPTDLVWCPGMKDWAQAATVPGLLAATSGTTSRPGRRRASRS